MHVDVWKALENVSISEVLGSRQQKFDQDPEPMPVFPPSVHNDKLFFQFSGGISITRSMMEP